jgi:hypothetical protein
MSNSYHLKNDNSDISVRVKVGTIGNASTIVTKHRSGGTFEEVAASANTAAGNIPKKQIGVSAELISSTLVTDVAILLDGVPKNQLDQAFENLFVRVTLFGGLDGEQFYDIGPNEKKQFMDKRLIVASKAIKLVPQP